MSEEEAIEIVKKYLNFNEICGTRNFKEALEMVLNLLKKKDKIMEAMAEYIANLDIDEDICKHNIEKMCKDEEYDVPLDVCISCIIQHFSK